MFARLLERIVEGRMRYLNALELINAKKELERIQKQLNKELAKGKFKDTLKIQQLRKSIRDKKIGIGDITKSMLLTLDVD